MSVPLRRSRFASVAWHVVVGLLVLALLYPIIQSIAVVYTANHYVVDLIIGGLYAAAAVFGVRRLWRRLGWPE